MFYDQIKRDIESLSSRTYWGPTRLAFNSKLRQIRYGLKLNKQQALIHILNYLEEILRNSERGVMRMIKKSGKDIKQSRVSVAGNNFQALVAYALMLNVFYKNLPQIRIVLKPKSHPIIENYAVIKVGDEEQKPDADILIYQDKPKTPVIFCSCKTSLRERAGQTYKWKLLLDLATADPDHLKKNPECPINNYKIQYKSDRKIYVSFITADLYNEVNQPQQRGMLRFFDSAFVTRPNSKTIRSLSGIIDYLNLIYKD